MSEQQLKEASFGVRETLELHTGESFSFGSKKGTRAVIIGRNPLSENLNLPPGFPQDGLIVKLLDTTKLDTSRQQMRIERGLDGRFSIENMSNTIAMKVNGTPLEPQRRILLTGRPQDLQRLDVRWGTKYAAHILRANEYYQSSDGKWSVGLKFD
jgi:hypothetical protein